MKQTGVTEEEYKLAIDCWNDTGCQTIKDYVMFYLKTDVFLSGGVFGKFRDKSLEYYEIDP